MSEQSAAAVTGYQSLRGYLTGLWTCTWTVERMIEDFSTGLTGTFSGTVSFTTSFTTAQGGPDDGALRCREQGTLRWASESGRPAEREYLWQPGAGRWNMNVHFADGRFFHPVNLHSGTAEAEHPCSPDLYRGAFQLEGPDAWSYRWRVTGPAKNLLLSTTLSRRQQPTGNPG